MDRQENKADDLVGSLVMRFPVYSNDRMTFKTFRERRLGVGAYFTPDEANQHTEPSDDIKGYRVSIIGGSVFVSDKCIDDAMSRGDFEIPDINLNF